MAGLPVTAVDGLRCEATWRAVQEILAVRRHLAAEGRALADDLHPVIALAGPGSVRRPRLVALRRAFFNRRRPNQAIWSERALLGLPRTLLARAEAWTRSWDRHRELLDSLDGLLTADLRDVRGSLRAHAAQDTFRHGLVQGSPALAVELGKWLHSPREPLGRKAELRLTKYLTRAAVKTSPYATFTLSGLGHWTGHGPAVRIAGPPIWRSAVEPNAWLVRKLAHHLLTDPGRAKHVRVRVNPSTTRDGERLWFVGERLAGVHARGPVLQCLAFDGTLAELYALLGRHGDAGTVRDYVAGLLRLGLLELLPPFADQSPDHLGELLRWAEHPANAQSSADPQSAADAQSPADAPPLADALPSADAPPSTVVRATLRRLHADLAAYPETRCTEQRAELREHIAAGFAAALPGQELPERNLFHENAVLTEPVLRCVPDHWQDALDDLDRVRRLLPVFQHDTLVKLVAAHAFAEHFGPGARVPLVRFYRELADEPAAALAELRTVLFPAPDAQYAPADSAVPAVRELAALRARTLAALRAVAPGPDGTARIAPELLPGGPPPADSVGFYVQRTDTAPNGPVSLVLNGVGAGYGQAANRVRRMLARVGAPAPGPCHRQDGVLLAESGGIHGSNLNLRPAAVPVELDCPGAVSDRKPEELIPLRELVVSYDQGSRSLRLSHGPDGPRVRPLHLGTMAGPLLPPLLRLLVQTFGETPNPAAATWTVLAGLPAEPPREVVARPRLAIGRVTVARASWCVRAGGVPVRHPGEADAGYLVRLAAWFADNGIPTRCFVRTLGGPDPVAGRDAKPRDPKPRDPKPMYLDLAAWSLVALFERQLQDPGHLVIFHEVLPVPEAAPRFPDAGRRVAEYVVELSAPEVRHDG
ncbi:lantibiotic dehydratase [Streptomyces sp. NPDC053079]|uniref:lantibiotic dehydratase n=1 Tax=Streptomyces sp. NPDC053079 TaxID=3365697 RepID=UPI0037CF338A